MKIFPGVKFSSCFFFNVHDKSMVSMTIQPQFGRESRRLLAQVTAYRSHYGIMYDVITCHETIYFHSSWQNRARVVYDVSLCLPCHDATAEMQHDLLEPFIRPGHLIWPQVRNSYWHFGFKSFRCDSTRGTRWCSAFSSAFPSSKVIFKNVDNEVSIIFCLTCPGNAKVWTKVAKSGIDGFRTSLNVRVIPCRIALAHLR